MMQRPAKDVVLEAEDLAISFGGIAAVDGVSFQARAGEIFSIIGPNGAGKTTLFNLMSGLYRPSRGTVRLLGETVAGLPPDALARRGLSRSFQNLQVFMRMSAVENVMVGRHRHEAGRPGLSQSLLAHLLAFPAVTRLNRESRAEAMGLLETVGLADYADDLAGSMPYGALKRLEIARALAAQPRVLLLDEPAAGCNPVETEEIDHLILQIARQGIGVILVEHDMKLVMRISNHILVLDRGKPLAMGDAATVRGDPKVVAAYLGTHGAKEAARA
jgi:branched-chain amino acid transport system ATP-binding protein